MGLNFLFFLFSRGFGQTSKNHGKTKTRRRMARERRGAESSVVTMETRFLHRLFYTQTLLHTDAFTHRRFLHAGAFTHRSFYTQTLLHTDPFTHRRFYTQTLLHTDAFYTQTLLHTETFTQRLLPAEAFTHRRFYTQRLLHTQTLLHTRFYTNTFTRRDCYRQTL